MNRRHFTTTLLCAMPTMALARSDESTAKKGWGGSDAKKHKQIGAHWHYNWGAQADGGACPYVPMLKGKAQIANGAFEKVAAYKELPYLLGFNEPERPSQGNLSLQEALDYWPKLEAIAEKKKTSLGSPAPSSDRGGMDWLDAFMTQAKRQKLKVDFIAIHYYRSYDPNDLQAFIKGLIRAYRLPVWLTEFNGWKGTTSQNERFLEKSLTFLEKESGVERYAYFEPGAGKPHSLFNVDGTLTKMGEMYRDAGT